MFILYYSTGTLPNCYSSNGGWHCFPATFSSFIWLILVAEEAVNVAVFRLRYFKRVDAWMRLFVRLV